MALHGTFAHLFHPQRSNNHRARVLHPEAFLFFIGFAAIFGLALTTVPRVSHTAGQVLGFSSSITAGDVVARTNAERQKVGLPELRENEALSRAAQAKGTHMFANQYWAHTSPDGTQPWSFFKQAQYNYSVAGGNLARDFSNASDMMQAWMHSPTHKANIVNQKYQEIGIAVIDGSLNGVETTLVVQFFGTPLAVVPQVPQVAAAQTEIGQELSETDRQAVGQADFSPTMLTIEQAEPLVVNTDDQTAEILGSEVLPVTQLTTPPLFSPLQLTKAFFLAIIFIVVVALTYDMLVMQHRQTARMVGKNFAHIMFFLLIAFLLIYFKSGVIA